MNMIKFRSYHGYDPVARVQTAWPSVSMEDAKQAWQEMEERDWSHVDERERLFQQVNWMWLRLGKPSNA